MKKQSIKLKITLWFTCLFLMMLFAILGILLTVGDSLIRTDQKEKLKSLTMANLEELEYLHPYEDRGEEEGDHFVAYKDGYVEIDDDFCSYRDGISISVYYEDTLLYGDAALSISPLAVPYSSHPLQEISKNGESYYLYDVKVENRELEGIWLRGIVNKKEGSTILSILLKLSLIGLPALVLVAILGGYLISKRGLEPLEDICKQAETISQGSDLTKQIEIRTESAETRELRDTMNQMLNRLRISFDSEKQFTSDASHELRTPVSVIMAECEYALSVSDTSEWKESLEVIARQSERMSHLIEKLLTYTRMEQQTISFEMEKIPLLEIITDVCQEQQLLYHNGISVHINVSKSDMVHADRALLFRMLTNLIGNAFKYGKENGNIWVQTSEDSEHLILKIADDGIGISEEDLEKIWNRFYRADNARSCKNSYGLGLPMVRQIAKLFHAEIKVSSKLNQGTTFLIYF